VPGVVAVDRGVTLLTGYRDADLIAVSAFDQPRLNRPVIIGTNDAGSFGQGNVLVGSALARSSRLRPGSRLRLDTPTGYAWVRVGGVWADGRFNGKIVDMPMWLFHKLYGARSPDTVGLIAAAGITPVQLAVTLRAAKLDPALQVDTPAERVARLSRAIGHQLAPFDALQRSLLSVSFVAVLSTLLLVGAQRRRELGILAAVGMTPGQLAVMTLTEGAAIGLISVFLSAFGAVAMEIALFLVMPIIIGLHAPLRFDFTSLLVWAPIEVLVVAAAAALPAQRNSRLEVIPALRYE
jgi:putative ABC transport system permease protein